MDNNPGHVSTSQKIPLNRYNNLTCTSGLAIQAFYHLGKYLHKDNIQSYALVNLINKGEIHCLLDKKIYKWT